jgi:hypothetical protein
MMPTVVIFTAASFLTAMADRRLLETPVRHYRCSLFDRSARRYRQASMLKAWPWPPPYRAGAVSSMLITTML